MDKQKKIITMFDTIAKNYDLANRVLSFGIDKSWRKKACDLTYEFYGQKEIDSIVDVACGTGDMLDFWHKRASSHGIHVASYEGIDPSVGMLEVARQKLPHFTFTEAAAQKLPTSDESVDIVSISYGIRNVVEPVDAIREFNRVLKVGGMVVILEFTKREGTGLMDKIVEFYMQKVLPKLGGLVSGNKEAYEYLPNSIDNFLTTSKMIGELEENGFEICYSRSFSFGISTLFIAKKVQN
jgi:demethylmenaquinone methyltransferase/2-methoxy-6-polyprenyl-1,4-benzoquinol methylase